MLNWIGIDQSMQMRETSRAMDKKPWDNNYLKKDKKALAKAKQMFFEEGLANGTRELFLTYIWEEQFSSQFGLIR